MMEYAYIVPNLMDSDVSCQPCNVRFFERLHMCLQRRALGPYNGQTSYAIFVRRANSPFALSPKLLNGFRWNSVEY
jgi:hypothetical protein